METLALICVVAGIVIYLIGSIGFIIAEFKTGILWGICGLLFQVVHIAYAILHFRECKKWLGFLLVGLALIIMGSVFGSMAA